MSMVSDYMIVPNPGFELPTYGSGWKNGVRGIQDFNFTMPEGVASDAVMSFLFSTRYGDDDGIDVAFTLMAQGYTWNFHQMGSPSGRNFVLPIVVQPGYNSLRFQLDKGGSIKGESYTSDFGGKGRADFGAFIIWYRRPA